MESRFAQTALLTMLLVSHATPAEAVDKQICLRLFSGDVTVFEGIEDGRSAQIGAECGRMAMNGELGDLSRLQSKPPEGGAPPPGPRAEPPSGTSAEADPSRCVRFENNSNEIAARLTVENRCGFEVVVAACARDGAGTVERRSSTFRPYPGSGQHGLDFGSLMCGSYGSCDIKTRVCRAGAATSCGPPNC